MSSGGEFDILSLSSSQRWYEYFQKIPEEQQDIYFTAEYYSLYQELGDGSARCFVFRKGEDYAIYPFLLNPVPVGESKPDQDFYDIQGAYGYNGVVTTTYNTQFIKSFYSAFDEYCKTENIIAEFTRFHPLLRNHLFSKNNLQVVLDRKTIFLDLQKSYNEIFANFQVTTRKQIKRATTKFRLELRVYEKDINIVDDFYNIYHEAMTRVKSIPYLFFNKSYFESLIERTENVCFMAFLEEKPVAAILAFYNSFYMNGHLGGALTDYLHMSPFGFLYSEMIKYGQLKGCRYLNVGGGATRDPDDTLLSFKKNFSKSTADFYIGKRIINREIYDQVTRKWESEFPGKVEMYKNFLLKYRY